MNLHHMAKRGKMHKLHGNYLYNRKQYTECNKTKSQLSHGLLNNRTWTGNGIENRRARVQR